MDANTLGYVPDLRFRELVSPAENESIKSNAYSVVKLTKTGKNPRLLAYYCVDVGAGDIQDLFIVYSLGPCSYLYRPSQRIKIYVTQ